MATDRIKNWLHVRSMIFADQAAFGKFTAAELVNYLEAIATEARLRLENPNFPALPDDQNG